MATKEEMIPEIEALAEGLKIDVNTDGLSSRDLSALLSDLKAKKRDADNETQADKPQEDSEPEVKAEKEAPAKKAEEPAPPVAKKAEKKGFFIAEGKSLTTKKGILGEGDEIKPEFLSGGIEAIKAFVVSGHVVKK